MASILGLLDGTPTRITGIGEVVSFPPVHYRAALMGAIPLALGYGQDAASRRPLGLVIVGGWIFSQLITLFVTPVIYLWLEWFQEHVLDKVPFLRSAHTHHETEPTPGDDGEVREPMPAGAG
jgi:hypothetical protein